MSTDEVEHQDDPYAAVDDDDDDGLTYVNVAEDDVDDAVELPAESDGKLLLSTLQGQYPNAIGMRYKTKSGGWRGVRISEGSLDPPPGGWGARTYSITVQKETSKRKTTEVTTTEEPEAKSAKQENEETSTVESEKPKASDKHLLQDMIVFGLSFQCKDEDLKEYFTSACGEMSLYQVKVDRETQKPRGFGFIRFKTVEGAKNALTREHSIMGRKCEVKLAKKKEESMNLFIGRIPGGTTPENLKEHFEQYGEICSSYVPTPFRGFGFVTFTDAMDGRAVLRMEHVMGDSQLNVKYAPTKEEKMAQKRREEFDNSRRGNPHDGPGFNRPPDYRDARNGRDRPPHHDHRDARPRFPPQQEPPRFDNRNIAHQMIDQRNNDQLKNILLSVLNSRN